VTALIYKVNLLKEKGLTGLCMATHWLAHQLKKQVHPGWEYNGIQDPTRESKEKMTSEFLLKHLGEMFPDTSSWLADEQVRPYHIGIERDPVRRPTKFNLHYFSIISYTNLLNAGPGQLRFPCP
jgi:hypothetical protein